MMYRVIKFGGSLFRYGDAGRRAAAWVSRQPPAENIWIAGGGEIVDVVRRWDGRYELGDGLSLRMTLVALEATRIMLCRLLEDAGLDVSHDTDERAGRPRVEGGSLNVHRVVSLLDMMREFPLDWRDDYKLASWHATSDTFAALVARVLKARELVLLKSCEIPAERSTDLEWLAECGVIDAMTPRAGRGIPAARVVSLPSDAEFEECGQTPGG